MKEIRHTRVGEHNGAPALFVNGRPVPARMYFMGNIIRAEENGRGHALSRFAGRGLNQFSCGFRIPLGDESRGPGRYDDIVRHMDRILSHSPDAWVLPRLCLPMPWRNAEPWLHDRYRGEEMVHRSDDGEEASEHVSFSSPKRWADWQRELPPLLRFLEERYGDYLLGYHLGDGATSEWAYTWVHEMSDFSAHQHAAFRDWLKDRYRDDLQALRLVWRDETVTFESAAIPDDRLRRPNQPYVRHPAEERAVLDYMLFHSEAAADLACRVCGLAARTLEDMGKRKVCGICYGYHIKRLSSARNIFNTGHQAMGRVLDCPDVDFIEAPYGYQWRYAGGAYGSQLLAGSLRLHNKLYICEDDTFTWRAQAKPWNNLPVCPDRRTTVGVLTRNRVGVLQDGGGQWWMDLRGEDWYGDDDLMDRVAALARLCDEDFEQDRRPTAQTAVIMDEDSVRCYKQDPVLVDCLNARQALELRTFGAPCDCYRLADLPRLLDEPWSERYRFFVFPDALHIPPDLRRFIIEELAGAGRTLLWTYAAGLATKTGLSVEAMSELVGIRLKEYEQAGPALVETWVKTDRLVYGANAVIRPIFYPEEADAEVLGWLLNVEKPGLVSRSFGNWCSVWSSAPAVPAPVLRELARGAGVHIYNEQGYQVLRAGSSIAVHAGSDGPCTLTLPERKAWTDALTGAVDAENKITLTVDMQRGDTRVWQLT